jgi:hypothetical protein
MLKYNTLLATQGMKTSSYLGNAGYTWTQTLTRTDGKESFVVEMQLLVRENGSFHALKRIGNNSWHIPTECKVQG